MFILYLLYAKFNLPKNDGNFILPILNHSLFKNINSSITNVIIEIVIENGLEIIPQFKSVNLKILLFKFESNL